MRFTGSEKPRRNKKFTDSNQKIMNIMHEINERSPLNYLHALSYHAPEYNK